MLKVNRAMQSALGDAAKQDGTQGVVAIAKKAQDLYKQQQEIQKKADQRYGSSLDRLAGSAAHIPGTPELLANTRCACTMLQTGA